MRTQEQNIRAEPSGAENGAERSEKSDERNRAGVGKNERNVERDVAEWEQSGEPAESAAHAAKACCPLYNLYSALFRGEAWPRFWVDQSIRFWWQSNDLF